MPSASSGARSSSLRTVAKTRQPSAFSARAQWAPMPDEQPVMMMTAVIRHANDSCTKLCVVSHIRGERHNRAHPRSPTGHAEMECRRFFVSLYKVVYDAIWHFIEDDGLAMASHVALSTLLAVFPFLIFGTALASFLGADQFSARPSI